MKMCSHLKGCRVSSVAEELEEAHLKDGLLFFTTTVASDWGILENYDWKNISVY